MLATSTPLILNGADLLPNNGGGRPKFSGATSQTPYLASSPRTLTRSSASAHGDGAPPSHLPRRPPLPPLLDREVGPSVVGGGAVLASMGAVDE
uniref:Uncharacterized protein n=1 Tax=Oryza barthii TaxID=65489 RepID=A0A0D3G718_9ORYZ